LPKTIQDAPELNEITLSLWGAFNELSTSRQMGFGVGYIPYSEVTSYLDENKIFQIEERKWMRKFINFIDILYVKKENERSETDKKSKKK